MDEAGQLATCVTAAGILIFLGLVVVAVAVFAVVAELKSVQARLGRRDEQPPDET